MKLLKILSVKPGSQAEQIGMQKGDMLISYNGTPLHSFDKLKSSISDAKSKGLETVEIVVARDSNNITIKVRPFPLQIKCSEEFIDKLPIFESTELCIDKNKNKSVHSSSQMGIISGLMGWRHRPKIICPYCQTQGDVSAKRVEQEAGVSGAKATGAILTGGLSLLFTGLSRKQKVLKHKCLNCKAEW